MNWKLLLVGLAGAMLASCEKVETAVPVGGSETSSSLLADPGRGFYRHTERRDSRSEVLDPMTLESWREQGTTLVLRVFYLSEFIDSPISAEYLAAASADFDAMEEAGVKGIVRFAYSARMEDAEIQQAGEARVLGHLRQLEPLLRDHAHVIHCVQAGFLGAWGEWHSAHPDFLEADGSLNRDACRRFMGALLRAVPDSLFVQVRTPWQKMMLFEDGDPGAARVGHHNDCLLASDDDFGTYREIDGEKIWLEEETDFLPMGGETCGMNSPRSSGESALRELERFHYNYLNADYHPVVLKGWKKEGKYDEIERRLGHRIRCTGIKVTDKTVVVSLFNEGFARPLYERPVEYRWTQSPVSDSVDFSIRSLVPSIVQELELPIGDGDLELRWPDPSPMLRDRGDYALCLANPEISRNEEGWHRIKIDNNPTKK
jgi:hypothetical protein